MTSHTSPLTPSQIAEGRRLPEGLSQAVSELQALANLIERPPLDDVLLEQVVALRSAKAIRTVLAQLLDAADRTRPDAERIVELEALVREAAERFREYEASHRAKLSSANAYDPHGAMEIARKVDRNAEIAARIEAHLAQPEDSIGNADVIAAERRGIERAAEVADEHASRGEPIGRPDAYRMASKSIAAAIRALSQGDRSGEG